MRTCKHTFLAAMGLAMLTSCDFPIKDFSFKDLLFKDDRECVRSHQAWVVHPEVTSDTVDSYGYSTRHVISPYRAGMEDICDEYAPKSSKS